MDNASLPSDPAILLSWVNTKLRDEYPLGLDALCAGEDVDRDLIVKRLEDAGFEYSPELNKFW